ncbi:MAG: FGGY family carbohydrate kinase, partial [Spirochaetaceae bacterium]|nr:FGGY family carbohydrate kinase [Spirochaetaceae bacterium]
MERAIAVIDIGMTNKKVAVYDERLRPLDSVSRTFEPLIVEGVQVHDLEGMEAWFLSSLAVFAKVHDIRALAVTTHGATLVCLDEGGVACAPCVYYTHEPGPEFQARFFALAGAPEAIQATTGTPALSALINPAKGLLFLKERFPEAMARTRLVLSYPQYWGYRLTGQAGAEGTYAGCHTYLWDWVKESYSSVARILGVDGMLPHPLKSSWDVLGEIKGSVAARTGLSARCIVTMGIHDSNASLLPHLAKREGRDFVLNSTGTWCVLMHPQEKYGFEPGELGKVVFFNRSAYNKPVKTAIFLGGMEYEAWSKAIAACGANGAAPLPEPGLEHYASLFREKDAFILPELVPGSGQFPGSRSRAVSAGVDYPLPLIVSRASIPAFLQGGAKAMAALNASLAIQTLVALERSGARPGCDIFTEGGFRKNRDYCAILAAALPHNATYLTDIAEATSLGAAMTAAAAL